MYKIIETFEYYVENPNDFCPVQEIVDKEKDLGVDAYWYNIENGGIVSIIGTMMTIPILMMILKNF